jgi:Uma2 family endonuclease
MNLIPPRPPVDEVVYPESDGLPMADNTRQLQWITTIYGNLAALYRERPDVFVAGNQFWYPVEGHPEVRAAPDAYVVFGRPKGHRGSYQQWKEDNTPMTVVFEVLSPGNDALEMIDKQDFYELYGAEEFYIYDPESNRLNIYLRRGEMLRREYKADGFVSPRLGIRFDFSGPEMVIWRPDGQRFLTFEELKAAQEQAEKRAGEAERDRGQAEQQLARLRALSRKALQGQASDEERAELERLLGEGGPTE